MSELLEIADRIVERSGSGERLEAYVARGVETTRPAALRVARNCAGAG